MPRSFTPRRHADGALDLDHHRRLAVRLRRVALRRAWRAAGLMLRITVVRPTLALRPGLPAASPR